MLRYKNTTNLSELQKYFSSPGKAIQTLFTVLRSLKIQNKAFQIIDKINTKHNGKQVFILLLLFPLFAVKDISHFAKSPLHQLYRCGKDVFYQFLNSPFFDWRTFMYHITKQLIRRVEKQSQDTEEAPVLYPL